MVQMKICGRNSKYVGINVEKPNFVLQPCREGQEIQKQYMFLHDSYPLNSMTQPSVEYE